MCGKANPDCGCDPAKKAAVEAAEAVEEQEVVTAAAVDGTSGLPTQWHAVLTVEGLRTTDHRMIAPEALTWRQLPLPIFAQFNNAGHFDAALIGQITAISRDETTGRIMGEGTFDHSIDAGQQAARMCQNQTLRWNSVDLEILASEYVEVGSGGGMPDLMDIILIDDDEECDWYDQILEGRIMGTTMVATPAFPQAVIAPIDMALDIPEPIGTAKVVTEGLLAAGIPVKPPAAWFEAPKLAAPTSLEVTDDGHVFGHLALWETCHIGFEGVCVAPPHSTRDYAFFRTGRLVTEDGEAVSVGQITYDTGHAPTTMGWQDTTAHYDHTGAAVADVAVGEDEFGIWFSGALRPGLSDETIRTVRAHPLSGDWRKIGGGLELVAALAVNVPGFPIVAAGKRQGEQVSLITGGPAKPDPLAELRKQMAVMQKDIVSLRAAAQPLVRQGVAELRDRVHPRRREHLALVASLKERVDATAS